MRRNALIIQNPGTIKDPLDGVPVDVREMQSYLRSLPGGAWDSDEITVLPSDTDLNGIGLYFDLFRDATDYFFIYFTGHGNFSSQTGAQCWLRNDTCFTHENLRDWVGEVPTLFINDCCKGVEGVTEAMAERKLFSIIGDSNLRTEYRREFDVALTRLPRNSFCIASAASITEGAKESSLRGGYYTSSLIKAAKELYLDPQVLPGVYPITSIHSLAAKRVEAMTYAKQTPEIEGYTRTLAPPFMVKL